MSPSRPCSLDPHSPPSRCHRLRTTCSNLMCVTCSNLMCVMPLRVSMNACLMLMLHGRVSLSNFVELIYFCLYLTFWLFVQGRIVGFFGRAFLSTKTTRSCACDVTRSLVATKSLQLNHLTYMNVGIKKSATSFCQGNSDESLCRAKATISQGPYPPPQATPQENSLTGRAVCVVLN